MFEKGLADTIIEVVDDKTYYVEIVGGKNSTKEKMNEMDEKLKKWSDILLKKCHSQIHLGQRILYLKY